VIQDSTVGFDKTRVHVCLIHTTNDQHGLRFPIILQAPVGVNELQVI
jgi:hypothetical protein